jgi:hypothetical protein
VSLLDTKVLLLLLLLLQVAFQIWMATSLLADSLAVASQTIIARSTAAKQLPYGRQVVKSAIIMAVLLGSVLSLILGASMNQLPALFTQDAAVLHLARRLMPVVAVTQPLNALAFVMDGVLYGAGGFKYASGVMLICATPSLGLMFLGQVLEGQYQQNQGLAVPVGIEGLGFSNARALQQGVVGPLAAAANSSKSLGEVLLQGLVTQPPSLQGYSSSWHGGICPVSPAALQTMLLLASSHAHTSSSSSSSERLLLPAHTAASPLAPLGTAAAGVGAGIAAATAEQQQQQGDEVLLPAAVAWVWAGMVLLMLMRAATILLPLACR